MGIFLAFINVILLTASIFLFGYAVRHSSLFLVLLLEIILGLNFIFPLLFIVERLNIRSIFTTLSLHNWLWLAGAALSGYVGGSYFSLQNLKLAGEKTNSLLSPAITAAAIAAGYFVFKEKLDFYQWSGILLTLSAVIYFLLKREGQVKKNYSRKGFVSGLLTILFVTLTIIFSIKAIDENIGLFQAIWFRLLIAFFIIFPFAYKELPKVLVLKNNKFYFAIVGAVIAQTLLGNYLWFYCSLHIGLALFQAILATLPFFVYAAEIIFLRKSRPAPSFLVAAFVALLGILLLTIF